MKKIIIIVCLVMSNGIWPQPWGIEEGVEQIEVGNFALPYSQQIGPLFSFGQNIIDPKNVQAIMYVDTLFSSASRSTSFFPYFLYGINDHSSIMIAVPFDRSTSCGCSETTLPDFYAQYEYSFYGQNTPTSVDQMSIVLSVSAPQSEGLSSLTSHAPAPGFFIGATESHESVDWYVFASQGVLLQTTHKRKKGGHQYYYEFGAARNFGNPHGLIFDFMVELIGSMTQRDKKCCRLDPNSGGNVIFIAPSIWISSRHFYVQFGCGFIISQRTNGHQEKNKFLPAVDMGWTFG